MATHSLSTYSDDLIVLKEVVHGLYKETKQPIEKIILLIMGCKEYKHVFTEPMSLDEVGFLFGFTRERTRQYEVTALKYIKAPITKDKRNHWMVQSYRTLREWCEDGDGLSIEIEKRGRVGRFSN